MACGGSWWSYFYKDGVRHQHSTGASNRRQAETIEAKLKEEVNNRRFQIVQADPNMTFGELAARFIASGIARPHHLYHLKFLVPFFAETPVLRLTKSFAEEFRRARQAGKSIKDATVNRDLSVLRHILYWSVDEQLLAANPLARMKMARERRTRRQVLSVAEEQLLLAAAKDHLRAMIVAALDTGMRRGEITSQRWEDIDPWVYFLPMPFLGEAFFAAFLAPFFGAAFLVAFLETAFLAGAFLAAVFGAAFFAPSLTGAFLVGFAGLAVAFVSGGAAAGAGTGGGAEAGAATDGVVAGAGVSFTSGSISCFSLSLRPYSNDVGLLLRCRVFLMVPQSLCADRYSCGQSREDAISYRIPPPPCRGRVLPHYSTPKGRELMPCQWNGRGPSGLRRGGPSSFFPASIWKRRGERLALVRRARPRALCSTC